MRILVAEDDFISRRVLKDIAGMHGECEAVVDGQEAIDEFRMALDEGRPYDVIFLDIMMPRIDGVAALKVIRSLERERDITGSGEVKVVMTTALDDPKTVVDAYYRGGATSYLVKPLSREKITGELRNLGLIEMT